MPWRVKVNDRKIQQETQKAAAKAEAMCGFILAMAEGVVEKEKETKLYYLRPRNDHTGNLEKSTVAYLTASSPSVCTVVLEMGTRYASYITDGTYGAPRTTYDSLSRFRVLAGVDFPDRLKDALDHYFDTEAGGFRATVA